MALQWTDGPTGEELPPAWLVVLMLAALVAAGWLCGF